MMIRKTLIGGLIVCVGVITAVDVVKKDEVSNKQKTPRVPQIQIVDSTEIMQKSKKAVNLLQEFEKKVQEYTKRNNEEKARLETAEKNLREKEPVMSAQAVQREKEQLVQQYALYEKSAREMEFELSNDMQRINQELAMDAERAAETLALSQGYDLVQDKSGRVLYCAPEYDSTAALVKEMNIEYADAQKARMAAQKTAVYADGQKQAAPIHKV